ncbi:adenosylcobinamide-GDP ribazoletransferase [Aliikangiella sp. G2MR2-5]|uniref:adenosylcobinamide-GDP ribazoletransferase n=1 Tax=Aliikangiella sp. G2MR2-5 TaxID=2788943 RepID=UPI0018AA541B|nr:adenosylcobinamide-GDP ribazoletransferase [Aliikangiella sp. G2MR2-5]
MRTIRAQLNLFFIALGFLTRLPVPVNLNFSQMNLNRASRYFSLIGWVVGAMCAVIFFAASQLFPPALAVAISMLFGLLLTGCFHEDGLADTCDGLGGGWNAQQKLSIMKDSRIGTYGAVALWTALTMKLLALVALAQTSVSVDYASYSIASRLFGSEVELNFALLALLVAHPLSRALSTTLIYFLSYVSGSEKSKVKPLAEKINLLDIVLSIFIGGLSLFLVPEFAIHILVACIMVTFLWSVWLKRQIGGFTGDALGATQQLNELSIYLTIIAMGAS